MEDDHIKNNQSTAGNDPKIRCLFCYMVRLRESGKSKPSWLLQYLPTKLVDFWGFYVGKHTQKHMNGAFNGNVLMGHSSIKI